MEQPKENESAYFVQDRGNQEEMARLEIQDKMITAGMGGVLPELSDPAPLRRVLDVGCGTGGWLIETAKKYPTIKTLFGVDISLKMIERARDLASASQLGKRVRFETKDALLALLFPNGYFDLVNQRFGVSWLRTREWIKILLEYQRVARPGGIIRITEGNSAFESNSPALTRFWDVGVKAAFHSGRLFTDSPDGLTRELAHLLTQYGIEGVQTRVHTLVYRAGTPEHQHFCEDVECILRVSLPFLQKWTKVPDDYQENCQQALKEMQEPDFVATMTILTAWGTKRRDGKPMVMNGLR